MIKFSIKSILIASLLIGCKTTPDDITPYDLSFPREKLVSIMLDLSLAESAAATYKSSNRDSVRLLYMYQISKVHGLSTQAIDSLLQEVYANPPLNTILQREVLDSLKSMEEKSKQFEKTPE